MQSINKCMVKDMPLDLRPRERLLNSNATALNDFELLAILLGSGTNKINVLDLARAILQQSGGLKGLENLTFEELSTIHGIGKSRACIILSLIELSRRIRFANAKLKLDVVSSSDDVASVFEGMLNNTNQEEFMAVYLDSKNQIIKKTTLFVGTLDCSLVHLRDIFRIAVKVSARHIICGHNHPSGDVTPSKEDINMTKRLVDAGILMDIPILDHIIINSHRDGRYYSFREKSDIYK